MELQVYTAVERDQANVGLRWAHRERVDHFANKVEHLLEVCGPHTARRVQNEDDVVWPSLVASLDKKKYRVLAHEIQNCVFK